MQDSHDTLRDQALVRRLLAELSAGRPFALATVLATRGSMPRHGSVEKVGVEARSARAGSPS